MTVHCARNAAACACTWKAILVSSAAAPPAVPARRATVNRIATPWLL
jgi:hypothetical protein